VTGDAAAAAKALRDIAKTNPMLVLKGGVIGGKVITGKDVEALADLPSRDVLLARFAGALQAPLVKTAGLLQALPRNFAYGLKALIEQKEAA
jgi:large subunit ribosomal protein L10